MKSTLARRYSRQLCIAVSTVLATGGVFGQDKPASTAVLAEVVVSAQKRAENLQEVPVSVTVLGADQIHELQISSGTEVARQTPNLRVSNLGNEDQPKFSMRGIATPDFNLNTTSPTGVFYDEVYVASQFLGGPQIFDLERIEVLRGPQGTLFGKNTTGGAVSFITRAPTHESEGYVSVQAGNNNYFHAQGALNMPLVDDKLATRLAFNTSKSDGWIKNYNPAGQDLSSINNYALRWSFLYEPTENFDATLRLLHSRSNPTNIGVIAYGTAPNNTNAFGVNPRRHPTTGQNFNAWEGYYDRVGGEIKADGDGGNLTLNMQMGDVTLTSITSYMEGDFKNNVDADGSIASLIHIDFYAQTEEVSQDLRLSSQYDGPFNFIVGLYYFSDKTAIQTDYFMFGNAFNPAQSYHQSRASFAAYADMTYDFTPTWTVYGGVRWTDDHGEVNDFRVVPTIPLSTQEYDDAAPTGRLGIRHTFSEDVMGYAQYSRGYRSSSINGSALTNASDFNVAEPEYLDSFEIGLKSQLLERRLQLNSSAFYYKYTDQQFVNAITLTESKMVNAGEATLYGLELEVVAQITEGLRATAGLALLHTNYDELNLSRIPVAGQVCPTPTPGTTLCTYDLAGNELIEAPQSSFNLALDYSMPVSGGHIGFHVDGVYMSSMYYTPWNDLPPSNLSVTPSQWEANARIGYRPTDGNFEIAVWGKNLNENDVAAGQVGADQSTFYQRFTVSPYPRRYGVEFNYNF
jgi:iron complex outermembrane receptor protein